MATKTQKKETPAKTKKKLNKQSLITLYMEYVLEKEAASKSVYKFCKENNITETAFYDYFGSFEGLKKGVWTEFFNNTWQLISRSTEYNAFTSREKLLTFYYTFFELLTANRSYALLSLKQEPELLKNLEQLKGLRRKVKSFASNLIQEGNENKEGKVFKKSETVFSEAAWLQLLFILKFWIDDNSAKFESTDVVIEKSVNTAFDIFDNTPLERAIDLGKFLWKEKMK